MIFNIYAVKDELTGTFMSPSTIASDAEALRAFKSNVNRIDIWKDNSADFGLYKLGTFNDANGDIDPCFEKVASGRSVLNE